MEDMERFLGGIENGRGYASMPGGGQKPGTQPFHRDEKRTKMQSYT
jgi:hypothetical protein